MDSWRDELLVEQDRDGPRLDSEHLDAVRQTAKLDRNRDRAFLRGRRAQAHDREHRGWIQSVDQGLRAADASCNGARSKGARNDTLGIDPQRREHSNFHLGLNPQRD